MNCPLETLPDATLPDGFCAFALPVSVSQARTVLALPSLNTTAGRLLILERATNAVVLLEDAGAGHTRRTLISAPGLNHGLALHGGYLYASSDTIVYRWSYDDLDFANMGVREIVVDNINADGQGGAPFGHTTRTLAFDAAGRLYVSVGSYSNVDRDSFRSRIRRFDNLDNTTQFPMDFLTGFVFADGLRNEVGLAFDPRHGVLWGVENGADNLQRDDLGGDITNDNPAEELHRFPEELAGSHFGYPYCWTEYLLPQEFGMGRGTVWAWPSFLDDGTVTDESCRQNYAQAEVAMQAHSAPLGITFYQWTNETPTACGDSGSFPAEMDGYAFIAFHGSWNRDIPTGYKVVYVPMDTDGRAAGQPVDLLAHSGPGARWSDGFRPVDVDFDECGRLLVSSDGTRNMGYAGSKIVRIEYHGTPFTFTPIPTPIPSISFQRQWCKHV